jgi:hypothetical protein
MATMKWLTNALLAGLIAFGCFWTRADVSKASDPPGNNQAGGGDKHVLDFSGSPNRGVFVGKFNNFAFRIDLKNPMRKISVPVGNQRLPDLISSFDYADCSKGKEGLLERTVRDLPRGDPAWVDELEVFMPPPQQREIKWSGGVCYGIRQDGKWYWNLNSTPLAFDSGTNNFYARIAIRRGPIDAIKLVFDYAVPPMYVSNVTFTTRAITDKPDPKYTPGKRGQPSPR